MKRGKTNAKRKLLAVAVKQVVGLPTVGDSILFRTDDDGWQVMRVLRVSSKRKEIEVGVSEAEFGHTVVYGFDDWEEWIEITDGVQICEPNPTGQGMTHETGKKV